MEVEENIRINKMNGLKDEKKILSSSNPTHPNSDKNGLPERWEIKKLGEVCKLKNGFAFKSTEYKSEGIPVIRISDINEGIVTTRKAVRVLPNEEYDNYLVEDNDILVAMSGATTGKFGIFKSEEKAYQNQRVGKFKILNEKKLNNQFLYYQLHALKRQIEKDAYGGAQPNISSTKIEQMEIVVPHISEQQKIVSKIEELFSELDKGKQQLETARAQLKIYRQSVLKWAFEGKLTSELGFLGLKEFKDEKNILSSSNPKNPNSDKLPEGWKLESLKNISTVISGFAFKSTDFVGKGTPVVKISNVGYSEFLWKDQQFLPNKFLEINSGFKVVSGDLLIALTRPITNDTTKVCKYPERTEPALLNQRVACIKNQTTAEDYIFWFFQTESFKSYIKSKFSETLQPNLSPKDLALTPIPLPHISEQQKIVEEIESRLSVADKVEETISQSLQQAETLRQSILKQAFEGKLV